LSKKNSIWNYRSFGTIDKDKQEVRDKQEQTGMTALDIVPKTINLHLKNRLQSLPYII